MFFLLLSSTMIMTLRLFQHKTFFYMFRTITLTTGFVYNYISYKTIFFHLSKFSSSLLASQNFFDVSKEDYCVAHHFKTFDDVFYIFLFFVKFHLQCQTIFEIFISFSYLKTKSWIQYSSSKHFRYINLDDLNNANNPIMYV